MVELNNVYKKYKGNTFYSVKDLSFKVEKGCIFGLLGNNGAGKSTTMKLLSTLYRQDSGSIYISGYDTIKNPSKVKQNLGYLFENPMLYEQLTGEENIVYYAKLFKVDKEVVYSRLKNLYEELHVDFQNQKVNTYSKGMKQKISFIRSIITDPKIILMDEPTGELDIISRNLIRSYTKKLKEQGKTIILTSHIAEDIDLLCDRVVIMNKGTIFEYDTIKNLKNKYNADSFENVYISIQDKIEKEGMC